MSGKSTPGFMTREDMQRNHEAATQSMFTLNKKDKAFCLQLEKDWGEFLDTSIALQTYFEDAGIDVRSHSGRIHAMTKLENKRRSLKPKGLNETVDANIDTALSLIGAVLKTPTTFLRGHFNERHLKPEGWRHVEAMFAVNTKPLRHRTKEIALQRSAQWKQYKSDHQSAGISGKIAQTPPAL